MFSSLGFRIIDLDYEIRPLIIAHSVEKRINDGERIPSLRVTISFEARHENNCIIRQAETFPIASDTLRQLKR